MFRRYDRRNKTASNDICEQTDKLVAQGTAITLL